MAKGFKSGGRKAGAQNKVTREIKDALRLLIEGNLDNMTTWLTQIDDPHKRMDMMMKIMEFVQPKLARTETHVSGTLNLTEQLRQLDGSL